MKRILSIALCAIMMAGAVTVSAQKSGKQKKEKGKTEQTGQHQAPPRRSADEMAKQRADRMKEQLSLNDAQYEKILALTKEQMGKMEAGREGVREDRSQMTEEQKEERREKMKEMREAHDAKVKEILTDEQYAKYGEMRKNDPRGGRPGGPKGVEHPERL